MSPSAVLLDCLGSYVSRIVFMPDDGLVAMSFCDGDLRVYDADVGSLKYAIPGHRNAVHGLVVLGPDLLASGDAAGLLCVWRASTGQCLFKKKYKDAQVWMIVRLDAGRFMASVGNQGLLVFNHHNGSDVTCSPALTSSGPSPDCVLHIGVSDDHIVTTSFNEKVARVWDVQSLTEICVLGGTEGRELGLQLVAIDSTHIVSAEKKGTRGLISIWDVETLSLAHKIDLPHHVSSPVILDERHMLISSANDTILLVDLYEGRVVYRCRVPLTVSHITVTNDGRLILAGSSDYAIVFPVPSVIAKIIGRSTPEPRSELSFSGKMPSEKLVRDVDKTAVPAV